MRHLNSTDLKHLSLNEKQTLCNFEVRCQLANTTSHDAKDLGRAKGGGGKTYRKSKPREDGLVETIFEDPPKAVSEGSPREIL